MFSRSFKGENSLIEMNDEIAAKLEAKEKLIIEITNHQNKARDEYKEELLKMEKKKEVSDKLIKSL